MRLGAYPFTMARQLLRVHFDLGGKSFQTVRGPALTSLQTHTFFLIFLPAFFFFGHDEEGRG